MLNTPADVMNEEKLWSLIDELEYQLSHCDQEKEKAKRLVEIMQTRVSAYVNRVSGTYFMDPHIKAIVEECLATLSEQLTNLKERISVPRIEKASLKEFLLWLKNLASADRSRLTSASSDRIERIEAMGMLSYLEHDARRLLHVLGLESRPPVPKRQPLWNEDRLWLEQYEWHSAELKEYQALWKRFLEDIRQAARKHRWQIPNQSFITYAWPIEENSQIEKWLMQFLENLRADLKQAGIEAKLDRLDNTTGRSIYNYMDEVTESSCVIVVGSASLLKKHRSATSAVCNELALIHRKRRHGETIFPLLLSGSLEESFPPYFELYTTVRDWQSQSYASNVQSLLREILDVSADNDIYSSLWKKFVAHEEVKALSTKGLTEDDVSKRKELFEELKLKEQELDQKESQRRLEQIRWGQEISLSERESVLSASGAPITGESAPLSASSTSLGAQALASSFAMHDRSNLESALRLLRQHVLGQKEIENELELYIPLSGAFSAGYDAELVDVEAMVNDFLDSNKKVLLLLAEAGAGKTTFGRYLERKLWKAYEASSTKAIPFFIPLTSLQDPTHHLLKEMLKRHELSKKERLELKTQRSLILILDGYDELNNPDNLYGSNQLHEWNVKVIITCRSPYLMGVYSHRFAPIDALGRIDYSVYQDFHLKPFTPEQTESYLQKYVRVRKPEWSDWQRYQQAIQEIPHLKELIETPYILYIVVEVLPGIVKKYQAHTPSLDRIRLTRADIYEAFIQRWFQKQEEKLQAQGRLTVAHVNMQKAFMNYAKGLASGMWKAGVNAITWQPKESCPFELEGSEGQAEARDSRWDKFFDDSANPQLNLVRSGCPLRKQGENQWLFVHKSLQEYLGARQIFDEAGVIPTEINQKLLTDEPSMIRFLADRATTEEGFKESLWRLIERSKLEESITIAAANAITILNYAGLELNQKDLRGIRIVGADLTGANLDHADLTGADLRKVNFRNVFLRGADLSGAKMAGVSFGLWPSLKHQRVVNCLCYSPDDKWLATGVGCEIYLWDLEASRIKHMLSGHEGDITSLSFRGDSLQLATGSRDKTVKLWEVSSGRLERSLKGHTHWVTCVSYRGDCQQLASGGHDQSVKLWEVSSGRLERSLEGHTGEVTSVSYRGDGQQLASGSNDQSVKLWEVSSGQLETSLEGHTNWVTSVSYRGDGQQLASGSWDKTVKLWKVSSGRLERSLESHTSNVTCVSYRGDGQQLASGSGDKSVKLWEVSSGRLERSLEGHINAVTCVSYRGDGQQLASGSDDGTVKLWEVAWGRLERRLAGHTGEVNCVSYRGDGQQLASGSGDKSVKLWEVSSGRLERSLEGHMGKVTCVSYRGDGQQLASGSRDSTVRLWEMSSGRLERDLKAHKGEVTCVSYRGDGQQLASGSRDSTVRLWEVASERLERSLEKHTDWVRCVSYRSDGQQLASGSDDKLVKLQEVSSGRLERSLEGHTNLVYCVSYRGDGQQLASGSGDWTVKLWTVTSGSLERSLTGHRGSISSVDYRRDGQQLASGSDDSTIKIWSPYTGQCLHVICGHLGSVNSVCFSPDNSLASGGSDNTIKVWREQDIRGQKIMVLHWSRGPHSFFAKSCQIKDMLGLAPRERRVLEEFEEKAIKNRVDSQTQTEVTYLK